MLLALRSCVEFVPSYTFLDDEEHYHPFFLRSAGLPLGLSYSVRCLDELSKPVFDGMCNPFHLSSHILLKALADLWPAGGINGGEI
jgi:hypothetical protein